MTDSIKKFQAKEGVIGFLDALGASSMNGEELRKLYLLLSKACATVTAGKDEKGNVLPNRSANTFLLGDGLIVAQNNGQPGAWSSAVRGIVAASYFERVGFSMFRLFSTTMENLSIAKSLVRPITELLND